ncbi:MAG: hypothetical protein GTN70_04255 [Deltaproteobacteria bacterium]|nr:hypothetical protein [Deltaproteobacteria bacterium]NIS76882.1 hypothetical protein [Deltaproteobacteria bacterium]
MGNLIAEKTHFAELDEEALMLIKTCDPCGKVLSISLDHVVVYGSIKCGGCGKINSFEPRHIDRAKEIISRYE